MVDSFFSVSNIIVVPSYDLCMECIEQAVLDVAGLLAGTLFPHSPWAAQHDNADAAPKIRSV